MPDPQRWIHVDGREVLNKFRMRDWAIFVEDKTVRTTFSRPKLGGVGAVIGENSPSPSVEANIHWVVPGAAPALLPDLLGLQPQLHRIA